MQALIVSMAALLLSACAATYPPQAANNAQALMVEGWRYETGDGVARDIERAFVLYREAAPQGAPEAEYPPGLMYELGIGTERDMHAANYWYERAVGQGYCPGELSTPADLAGE
jgi:TPR repeat protein